VIEERTLTEAEVKRAASSVHCLEALRRLQGCMGELFIGGTKIPLTDNEADAVVALLIERHASFLTGLGVALEVPTR